jgi:cobalamin synthase
VVVVHLGMSGQLLLAGAATLGLARFARARLGGHNGDVLGAVEQSVECVALSLLAARGG